MLAHASQLTSAGTWTTMRGRCTHPSGLPGGRASLETPWPRRRSSGAAPARRPKASSSPRDIHCTCTSSQTPRAADADAAAAQAPAASAARSCTAAVATAAATVKGALQVRVADPSDAAALAALDSVCAADGSSGWSEGIYQADLRPGGPNLILLCELVPTPSTELGAAAIAAAAAVQTEAPPLCAASASGEAEGPAAPRKPLAETATAEAAVVALAAGCEVAGEVSLTNLAVSAEMRGAGLGRRMACELLSRLGAERCPTFLEVRKDNAAAQALYGRLGFEAAGVRKRYNPDGSDSLVMIRQPAPLLWLSPPPPS